MNRNPETAALELQQTRIMLALMQINNITELLKDNEYKVMIYGHLISIKVELDRQLSCLTSTNYYTKIKE